jgi:hypothetical protein
MFGEILNLAKFVREIIVDRSKKVGGWKKIYNLYLSLDAVIDSSLTASEHCISMPLDPRFLQPSQSSPAEIRWIRITNEDFKRLDRAVKSFLVYFSEAQHVLEIYDEDLEKSLRHHFNFKRGWIGHFIAVYSSGEIEPDGKRIKRTALSIIKTLEESFDNIGSQTESAQEIYEEVIDISTHQEREKLIQAGRQNIEGLKKVKADLAAFIKQHCKIEDLL